MIAIKIKFFNCLLLVCFLSSAGKVLVHPGIQGSGYKPMDGTTNL